MIKTLYPDSNNINVTPEESLSSPQFYLVDLYGLQDARQPLTFHKLYKGGFFISLLVYFTYPGRLVGVSELSAKLWISGYGLAKAPVHLSLPSWHQYQVMQSFIARVKV